MSEHMRKTVAKIPEIQKIINPTATADVEVWEQVIHAVPQALDITLTMPQAYDADGLGLYVIHSDGNAAGNIIVAFPSTSPDLADQTLRADDDYLIVESRAGAWYKHAGRETLNPGTLETDGIYRVDVTVTTAQVLALLATPIELVAAPGAGKALIFEGAMLFLDYNSAAYAGVAAGENLQLSYTDGSGLAVSVVETVGFIDQTNDEHVWAMKNQVNTLNEVLPVANAALVISMLVGEIITGNSPLKVRTYYRVVETAF